MSLPHYENLQEPFSSFKHSGFLGTGNNSAIFNINSKTNRNTFIFELQKEFLYLIF
jgi:hypothetical protein